MVIAIVRIEITQEINKIKRRKIKSKNNSEIWKERRKLNEQSRRSGGDLIRWSSG
jgi:hypothetical protein